MWTRKGNLAEESVRLYSSKKEEEERGTSYFSDTGDRRGRVAGPQIPSSSTTGSVHIQRPERDGIRIYGAGSEAFKTPFRNSQVLKPFPEEFDAEFLLSNRIGIKHAYKLRGFLCERVI